MLGSFPSTRGAETNARAVPLVGQEVCVGGIPWALVLGVPPPPFAFVVTTGVIPFFVEGVPPPVPGVCPANGLCLIGVVPGVMPSQATRTARTPGMAGGGQRGAFLGALAALLVT